MMRTEGIKYLTLAQLRKEQRIIEAECAVIEARMSANVEVLKTKFSSLTPHQTIKGNETSPVVLDWIELAAGFFLRKKAYPIRLAGRWVSKFAGKQVLGVISRFLK